MRKINAVYRITTPLFLGGADIERTAELKPTSLKGVLRFWFRAVNYGKHKNYREVKKAEDKIFGNTNAQSNVFFKIETQELKIVTQANSTDKFRKLFKGGTAYLGYGLDDRKGGEVRYRPYIRPDQAFQLKLLLKPRMRDKIINDDLIMPIKALGLFGGLGSRSRRGFGSLTLDSIVAEGENIWSPPKSKEDLIKTYQAFYSSLKLGNDEPEYTAFSKNSRTIVLKEYNSFSAALKEVGGKMMAFRRDCKKDAKLVSDFLKSGQADSHPERVAFGLPHNYFFAGMGERGEATIDPIVISSLTGDRNKTRRASPLFIKIVLLKGPKGTTYIPVITLFPSKFLPPNSQILMAQSEGRKFEKELKPNVSYKIVNEFMDQCKKELDGAEVRFND
ncbi:MAG: type III-B CRISPR module RAMP protein Cmr1 [Firmicutes bacterium]|nr:type III-B CRISPR module RAMP protein Cmr1 [Bacillota bacterium]